MKTICPHTYARPEATIQHLELDLKVDFLSKTIRGTATYSLNPTVAEKIYFDIHSLDIHSIWINGTYATTDFEIGPHDSLLGQALSIRLPQNTLSLTIHYSTREEAPALQWLNPEQTTEGTHPFLYTQGQPIMTRSWIPIQDTPSIRITYGAKVTLPSDSGMMCLMSARNPKEKSQDGVYQFSMNKPIPSYLISLAIGNLSYQALNDNMGVYAEPVLLEASAWELEEVDQMMHAAQEICGNFLWEQQDFLILPKSFPYGGMENPRLIFITPTLLAGDKSLVSLVAHELAHSWSGNLVTNASWNDFWLNEGFTVYLERRILEMVYGEETAELHAFLGYQDLMVELDKSSEKPKSTHLKLNLQDQNPEEAITFIPYEKGYFFIKEIEKLAGRDTFDIFLKKYFEDFRFKSITTEQFLEYLFENLLDPHKISFAAEDWVYAPGLPQPFFLPLCHKFKIVDEAIPKIVRADAKTILDTRQWETQQWIYFIRKLSDNIQNQDLLTMDQSFGFSTSGNSEILFHWFLNALQSEYYKTLMQELEQFLTTVGRRKFILPLYEGLIRKGEYAKAKEIYTQASKNYHSIARNSIEALF
jgi:leukotriene-A4 hydrolase